jgi:hypothetical protein
MAMQGITRANFGQHFMPVAWNHIDMAYGSAESEYGGMFKEQKTSKAAEYSLYTSGLGAAMMYDEMESLPMDRASELGTARVVMEKVGLGFALSFETVEDEQAESVNTILSKLSEGVGKGIMAACNQRAFLLLNEATTATRTYYDNVALASASHPMSNGQTINNLTTNEMSETSVKDALIAISNLKDDRGLPANLKAKGLVTTKENHFRAKEIFDSALSTTLATVNATGVENATSGVVATTNTNRKNVIQGTIPGGVSTVNYINNAKAWAILTDTTNGFVRYDRKAKTNRDWTVDGQEYHVYGAHLRDAFYCADPARAIYWANPV